MLPPNIKDDVYIAPGTGRCRDTYISIQYLTMAYGIQSGLVYKWIEEGLPNERSGTRYYFNLKELLPWLSSRFKTKAQGKVDTAKQELKEAKAELIQTKKRLVDLQGKVGTDEAPETIDWAEDYKKQRALALRRANAKAEAQLLEAAELRAKLSMAAEIFRRGGERIERQFGAQLGGAVRELIDGVIGGIEDACGGSLNGCSSER